MFVSSCQNLFNGANLASLLSLGRISAKTLVSYSSETMATIIAKNPSCNEMDRWHINHDLRS